MMKFLRNTMFRTAGLVLVLICPMTGFLPSQQEHEKIVEEVSVNWWQVPVFAVDDSGNPVTDLQPGDIQVRLNGREIPEFFLYKRSFSVIKREKEKEREIPAGKHLPMQKNKVLFFLFDLALSSETSIITAKNIAEKIVADAEADTRFFVMTIDALSGLVYIGEGSGSSKDQLLNMIKSKVKEKRNRRYVSIEDFIGGVQNDGKYEPGDFQFLLESSSKWNKQKSMGFLYSFETLYLFLNSIEDNKFIYLFSEGMSDHIIQSSRNVGGETGKFYYYFKNAANSLSRGGAVVFIINSTGMLRYSTLSSPISGQDSLHWLAKESGGTYMEGTPEKIVERLENMHRAYYEISFPDLAQLKSPTRKVSIKSKRKGIKIHSLHTLEKRKQYAQMKPVEKELLVLNLVTQPQNTLTERNIHAYNARVDKTKKSKKGVTYTVTLPPDYLHQHIDLYKVWLEVNDQGMARLEKMEKESLTPPKNPVKIQFQFPKSKKPKEKEEETAGEIQAYFVLVNQGTDPARAAVHGIELYQEDPQLLELERSKAAAKAKESGQAISAEELNHILQGAADYCQRLKQSAFHFYCREKIVETRIPLTGDRGQELNIDEASKTKRIDPRFTKTGVALGRSSGRPTKVKSHIFGYRLIKQGDQIKEERDWISSHDNNKVNRNQVVETNAFFSEKAVFAPITILDPIRQDRYNFQFIRFDDLNGRRAAVIEALPKDPVETATIYGTLWIDMEDFSLVKIEANPESIRNYRLLKDLALKLRTRLHLSMEVDFDLQQEGIRFPTKVVFLEKYKGGGLISMYQGPKGWERTRTEFTYSDYQFFSVQTDVTVH
jgi:hypothetical protein